MAYDCGLFRYSNVQVMQYMKMRKVVGHRNLYSPGLKAGSSSWEKLLIRCVLTPKSLKTMTISTFIVRSHQLIDQQCVPGLCRMSVSTKGMSKPTRLLLP